MPRADSPLRDRVVFLVGARRSGTNWLQRILTAHPDMVGLPSETYLFSNGVAPFAELIQHANPGGQAMGKTFMERDHFLDAMRDLLDAVLADNLAHLGPDARYIAERTPWHVLHLPLIADVYPDARVVNIVRDGRAVARSLMAMHWGPKTMEEAAEEWRDAIEGGRAGAEAFGERYLEVGYERLLASPRERTAELFGWLGLELADETWERILVEAATEFNVDPGSPGVRTDKWRDELSAEDLRTFERVAGPQLAASGYDLAGDGAAAGAPSRDDGAGRVPSLAGAVRAPRELARGALDRTIARRARAELHENYEMVERLQSLLQAGDDDAVRSLFGQRAWVRVVDGEASAEARGEEGVRALLEAVASHRERGLRPLTGEVHASPTAFTSVGTYELDDGSRWSRTLVIQVRRNRVTRLALHRQRVYM